MHRLHNVAAFYQPATRFAGGQLVLRLDKMLGGFSAVHAKDNDQRPS